MALTFKDIERVANLARLELRPDETAHTLAQLNGFFALVGQMQAIDTDGVEPLAHPAALLGMHDIFEPEDPPTRAEIPIDVAVSARSPSPWVGVTGTGGWHAAAASSTTRPIQIFFNCATMKTSLAVTHIRVFLSL